MNPVVKLAASALPGEKKYVLFAGAGVSKDAGMPTAWDLMHAHGLGSYAENGASALCCRRESGRIRIVPGRRGEMVRRERVCKEDLQ